MKITYIGHATLLLEIGETRLLTDPNFDPKLGRILPRVSPPGIALEKLPSSTRSCSRTRTRITCRSTRSTGCRATFRSSRRRSSRRGCADSDTRTPLSIGPGERFDIATVEVHAATRRIAAIATASIAGEARRTCTCSTAVKDDLLRRRHGARRGHAGLVERVLWEHGQRTRSRAAADRLRAVVEARLSKGPSHARRRARAVRAAARADLRPVSLGNVPPRDRYGARRDPAAARAPRTSPAAAGVRIIEPGESLEVHRRRGGVTPPPTQRPPPKVRHRLIGDDRRAGDGAGSRGARRRSLVGRSGARHRPRRASIRGRPPRAQRPCRRCAISRARSSTK